MIRQCRKVFQRPSTEQRYTLLQRFYNIILTDCGTGLVHSTMAGILDEADALVIVASPAADAARSGLATLDWLQHHGYSHLVSDAVIVISSAAVRADAHRYR